MLLCSLMHLSFASFGLMNTISMHEVMPLPQKIRSRVVVRAKQLRYASLESPSSTFLNSYVLICSNEANKPYFDAILKAQGRASFMPERYAAQVPPLKVRGEAAAYSCPADPSLVKRNPCRLFDQSFLLRDSETFFEVDQVQVSRGTGPTFTLKYQDPERYSYCVTGEEMEAMLMESFSLDKPHSNGH